MCRLCLNNRLTFDAIMLHQKEKGRATFSSVSDFLMNTGSCLHNDNGYFKLECCIGKCSKCKNRNHPAIDNLNKGVSVKFYLHELTKTRYKDKANNKFTHYNKANNVTHSNVIINNLLTDFMKSSSQYLKHISKW